MTQSKKDDFTDALEDIENAIVLIRRVKDISGNEAPAVAKTIARLRTVADGLAAELKELSHDDEVTA